MFIELTRLDGTKCLVNVNRCDLAEKYMEKVKRNG